MILKGIYAPFKKTGHLILWRNIHTWVVLLTLPATLVLVFTAVYDELLRLTMFDLSFKMATLFLLFLELVLLMSIVFYNEIIALRGDKVDS